MRTKLLGILRELRSKADQLAATVVDDHSKFAHTGKRFCYYRLPTKPLNTDDPPSVSPTCTAWMALSASNALKNEDKSAIEEVYIKLLSEPWDTGKLKPNNAFTVAVFSRAVGHLAHAGLLGKELITQNRRQCLTDDPNTSWTDCNNKNAFEIAQAFINDPRLLKLDPFPASPTIGYWMIDAAQTLPIDWKTTDLKPFAQWASSEFFSQYSLVSSSHQSKMDPIALAMSSCVCNSILSLAKNTTTIADQIRDISFPSEIELLAAIRLFFSFQNSKSGVWEKYFPIFHYPASGPNHCWHFEVLEAIIHEFPDICIDLNILNQLLLSVQWLTNNRLSFLHNGKHYFGWNAGGDIKAMKKDEPESWPTGVAHMFLARLSMQLSHTIRDTVLEKYGSRVLGGGKITNESKWKTPDDWNSYMDFDFEKAQECKLDATRNSVKNLIEVEILSSIEKKGISMLLPHQKLSDRHSAVLFGPPGTAKTTLCKAIAKRLGWPYLELSPSDFLGGGLEGIYDKVSEVFEDLLDLFSVVILFDEMDALVQNRATNDNAEKKLEMTQLLLTTSMLPKLAHLHEDARSIYFMATNYIDTFDSAIIRSGRFDLLVHIGPPSTNNKITNLNGWCKKDDVILIEMAKERLRAYCDDTQTGSRFGRLTFGETKQFFNSLRIKHSSHSFSEAILASNKVDFIKELADWANSRITLSEKDPKTELNRYEENMYQIKLQ